MNLFYHINEIKVRFIYLFFCFIVTFIVSNLYIETFIFLIIKPLSLNFVFMNLFEGFYCFFLLAFFLTCFFTLFIFYFSIFDFLKPGMFKNETVLFLFVVKLEIKLSFLSILFSHNVFLPFTINFFLSFQQNKFDNLFNFFFQPKLLDYILFFLFSIFIFFLYFNFHLLFF
jgi:sec-independent protein translocase protein TatC